MELLLSNFFNFFVVLLIGVLTHKLFSFLCYMVIYGTIRKTSDGLQKVMLVVSGYIW